MAKDFADGNPESLAALRARAHPRVPQADGQERPPVLPDVVQQADEWKSRPWLRGDAWPVTPPPPQDWLLECPGTSSQPGMGVLPTGKVGLLAAPGGTGKTFALTALAFSIALGRPWFGNGANTSWLNCPRRGRVVLLLGEDDTHDVQRRILTQARALGLCDSDRAGVNAQLLALGGQGQRSQLLCGEKENYAEHPVASGLYELLRQEALERGPFRAILLDPLSRFSPPEAETDNHAATRLVEVLERFAGSAELGRPLVMASHHTRKGNGEGADPADRIRGSSGLRDGVRWAALMTREEIHPLPHLVEGLVRIECVKSNVGAWPKALHLARVAGGALRGLSEEEQAVLEKGIEATKRKPNRIEKSHSTDNSLRRIVGRGP